MIFHDKKLELPKVLLSIEISEFFSLLLINNEKLNCKDTMLVSARFLKNKYKNMRLLHGYTDFKFSDVQTDF